MKIIIQCLIINHTVSTESFRELNTSKSEIIPKKEMRQIRKVTFKPVPPVKCPKCNKNVYAAEEVLAAGTKFHKMCFSCSLCKKMLESTNMTEHGTELFCKTCYGRKYGPKGCGFAGMLSMDIGEHFGNRENFMTNVPGCPISYSTYVCPSTNVVYSEF